MHGAEVMSAEEFFARARARLTLQVPAGLTDPNITPQRGDHDVDPVMEKIAAVRPIRPAAVLVPIVDHPRPTVLLTQRAQHLPDHGGQVSFPGGKIDQSDASPLESALREAREEIGLGAEFIEPLGFLDAYRTGTGFEISPLVGLVRPGFALTLDRREVLEVFEVPLRHLMNVENHEKHTREWRGRRRTYYAIPYEGRYIWGATAGMLKNMHARLFLG